MDNQVRNIAPFINERFLITSKWWNERINPVTGQPEIHRGLDIATSGKKNVYSILTGVVHSLGTDSSRGNWIIIWDNREDSPTYGYASLFMHLDQRPLLTINQPIQAGQYIGLEGSSGTSTGVHLHIELQDISRFNFQWHSSYVKSDYLDPTIYMGIDNIQGTWWIYDGTPIPPSPSYNKREKFPWVLYTNKIRNRINV